MAMSRVAAKEWGKYGIVTNVFLPVLVGSNFDTSEDAKQGVAALEGMIPVNFVGKPYEDGAPLLVFLASEEARYINGQMICIDGGWCLIA